METYETACSRIAAAKTIHDLFGPLDGTTQEERRNALRKAFVGLVRLVHPDKHGNDSLSAASFRRLMELHAEAEGMIAADRTDSGAPPLSIKTRKAIYEMQGLLSAGDICDVYRGLRIGKKSASEPVALKILRETGDGDLFANGADKLKSLWSEKSPEATHFQKYLPALVDVLEIAQPGGSVRKVQILDRDPDFVPLTEVLSAFSDGLDPRDAAWMGNRLFEILTWVHSKGVVHAAVLPTHILIRPEDHALKLIGWSASLQTGESPRVVSPDYRDSYPPEVFARAPATPALDIYMAAKVLVLLMGGKTEALPKRLSGFIKACLLHEPAFRFPDGRSACLEFKETLRALYGPPTFRPFSFPSKDAG